MGDDGAARDRRGEREGDRRRVRRQRRQVAVAVGVLALLVAVVGIARATRSRRDAPQLTVPRLLAAPAQLSGAIAGREARAIASLIVHQHVVRSGGGHRREVALTFDDGPGPQTRGVLAALHRVHAHATFFPVGTMIALRPADVRAEVRAHDVVGDHTESHPNLRVLPPAGQLEQLQAVIQRLTLAHLAARPTLFRPPYGLYDIDTLRAAQQLGLLTVLWSVDTQDYRQPGTPAIIAAAVGGARPGAIILLHDGGGLRTQTVQAVPRIVRGLRARHLRVVTLPRLLADDPPAHP